MKLQTRITLTLVGVVSLGAMASAEALLVAREIGRVYTETVSSNMASIRAAEELELALLEQRGLVSSHIMSHGDPHWLAELEEKKAAFAMWQRRAVDSAHTPEEHALLAELATVYEKYDDRREEVIRLYTHGETDRATEILLVEVNALYRQAYAICEGFLAANERYIAENSQHASAVFRRASVVVAVLFVLTLLCGAGVFILFFRGVLRPLRQMAADAQAFSGGERPSGGPGSPDDELRAVGYHLRSLMSNVTETQSSLDRSRDQLMSAEKLSSLGRLGASICHEIRNPLTAIEMHLFSIQQAVKDRSELADDFRVVSEQIEHLENTVHNFLEFSRPPLPSMKPHDVHRLLDKTLELCGRWLDERGVSVERVGPTDLPPVMVDSEQIKQTFLNLFRNAAEAMVEGGTITISTNAENTAGGRGLIVVRIKDTGPGVPEAVRERILEPFFSTKPDGTGLGLCIAARIMAQHDGRLELEPPNGGGACFAVWLPVAQET